VIAVQNPLTSLADDIATTKRVIDAQKGPVVVAGHSYGGAVITAAAAGSPNVKALVYVAAFAPEVDEILSGPGEKFAPPALSSALVPDAAGFLYVDRAKVHDVFCKDVPAADASRDRGHSKTGAGSVFSAHVPEVRGKRSRRGTSSHPKIARLILSWNASMPSASARPRRRSSRATCRL
jgi:pimeloyl-ACP methyl ester carboxylesterase